MGFYDNRCDVTGYLWIADVSWWARTLWSMVGHMTNGSKATVAWIFTTFVSTCQVVGAFFINGTFRSFTSDLWVSSESVRAIATSTVV